MALLHRAPRITLDAYSRSTGDDEVRARLLDSLGVVSWAKGGHDEALEHLRKSLAIEEKALGPEHPDVAWPLSGMGSVFVDQGRPQRAIGPLERVVRICDRKTCEPEHHGRGLFALARALVATGGDTEHAIDLVKQAREEFGKASYLKEELEEVNAWLKQRGRLSRVVARE